MRNEPNFVTFLDASSSRIEVSQAIAKALTASTEALDELKRSCQKLGLSLSAVGQGYVEDQYRAYQTAAAIFVFLADWKHAIRKAEQQADRFLDSAKLRVSELDRDARFAADERLAAFSVLVKELNTVDELAPVQKHLMQWDLPLLLFATQPTEEDSARHFPKSSDDASSGKSLETTVAFLKFEIDGEPAKQWNHLRPMVSYDLTIEVRVSNWPDGANALLLKPMTIDAREREWLPDFEFAKPAGNGPYSLTGTGRAIVEAATSFGSRPYEFLYAAEFDDMSNCRSVEVIGHRRLLVEGSDVNSAPLSGFSNVDRHLLSVRDSLRAFPGLNSDDISNTMIVLSGIGNIAAQALRDGLFDVGVPENQFQSKATEMLRNRPDIGERLQGHQTAGGGVTDLSFENVPIELKAEKKKSLFPSDCSKFFDQLAAYAIALGRKIGVLSVLDTSPKKGPLGAVEDDIEVFFHQAGKSQIAIVVTIIRGGFPVPSAYSK